MPSLGGWRLAALGQAGKKPKISPASWAWAARGSSHPGPPRVSEGVRVCRSSVPSPGHRGQSRAPGARPRRGAAPGCSLVSRGGGALQSCRASQEEGGILALPLRIFTPLPLSLPPFLVQICRLWLCGRGSSECLGQQSGEGSGQVQPGGRGLDGQLSRALGEEPDTLPSPGTPCANLLSALD